MFVEVAEDAGVASVDDKLCGLDVQHRHGLPSAGDDARPRERTGAALGLLLLACRTCGICVHGVIICISCRAGAYGEGFGALDDKRALRD